jgi:NADH-quinone oxidoreductase subunit J
VSAVFFHLFAAVTLLFGVLVVVSRNPVTSALSLAMSFVGLAALFVGLDAYFIGAIQVLVYAGAVMVLFLFIIMLMDVRAEQGKKPNLPAVIGAVVLAVLFVLQVATILGGFEEGDRSLKDAPLALETAAASTRPDAPATLPTIKNDLLAETLPDTKLMGFQLYHHYTFHLQIVGLLLLVGTVGVVVLSKKEKGGPLP